jgi:hypothetical protein
VLENIQKKTEYATLYAVRLLSEFLDSHDVDIVTVESHLLDKHLSTFYAHLRKEDGEEMCSTSLCNIRYGLARHFRNLRSLDLLKDPLFTHSNEVFSGKLAKVKRMGKGVTTHYDIISDDNLLKIASLTTDTPEKLQLKHGLLCSFILPNEAERTSTTC